MPIRTGAEETATKPPVKSDGLRYVWQKDEVYRYQYAKIVEFAPAAPAMTEPRRAVVSGILIFEVRKTNPDGSAEGNLRFDMPSAELPARQRFSAQWDAPQEERGGDGLAVQRATAAVIAKTLLRVRFLPDGGVVALGWEPSDPQDRLRPLEYPAQWRKRMTGDFPYFFRRTLGLEVGRRDTRLLLFSADEEFPCLTLESAANEEANERLGVASDEVEKTNPKEHAEKTDDVRETWALFPFYIGRQLENAGRPRKTEENGKAFYAFGHRLVEPLASFGEQAAREFVVPGTAKDAPAVKTRVRSVKTEVGEAVFDVRSGLLDYLRETWTADIESWLTVKNKKETANATVRQTYELQRLAPMGAWKKPEDESKK